MALGELIARRQRTTSGAAETRSRSEQKMGDTNDASQAQSDNGQPPQEEPGWARRLRAELEAERKQLNDEKAALKQERRDLLFDKVGIPAEKVGKLFRDSYDGELTEEAIRAAAIEHGVIEQPRTTPDSEREAHERAMDALAGANAQDRVLSADLDARLTEMIENAKSADEIDEILKRHKVYVYDA